LLPAYAREVVVRNRDGGRSGGVVGCSYSDTSFP
jgi:hypothetical protein